MRDRFAEAFMAENKLEGDDAFFRLVTGALHTSVDINHIECMHAVIRRSVYQKSIQTHVPTLERISAEFLAHALRQRSRTIVQSVGSAPAAAESQRPEAKKTECKTYKPGAFRAFLATEAAREAKGRLGKGSGDSFRALRLAWRAAIEIGRARRLSRRCCRCR